MFLAKFGRDHRSKVHVYSIQLGSGEMSQISNFFSRTSERASLETFT